MIAITRLYRALQPRVVTWHRYGSSGWSTIGSVSLHEGRAAK